MSSYDDLRKICNVLFDKGASIELDYCPGWRQILEMCLTALMCEYIKGNKVKIFRIKEKWGIAENSMFLWKSTM